MLKALKTRVFRAFRFGELLSIFAVTLFDEGIGEFGHGAMLGAYEGGGLYG